MSSADSVRKQGEQSGCNTTSAESDIKQGGQAAHLCRQALVEGFEVAAQGAAARHEQGLTVPPVHGAVPEGSKPLVCCIQPLPLLPCSAGTNPQHSSILRCVGTGFPGILSKMYLLARHSIRKTMAASSLCNIFPA